MAKLTASKRASLPRKEFGLPGQGSGPTGSGAGSYPMPDKKHAALAEGFAKRFASPAQKAKIDAKASKVLGKKPGGGGLTAKQDARYDKAHGIKAGSAADKKMDKRLMQPGGGGSPIGKTGGPAPVKGAAVARTSPPATTARATGGSRVPAPRRGSSVRYGRS